MSAYTCIRCSAHILARHIMKTSDSNQKQNRHEINEQQRNHNNTLFANVKNTLQIERSQMGAREEERE